MSISEDFDPTKEKQQTAKSSKILNEDTQPGSRQDVHQSGERNTVIGQGKNIRIDNSSNIYYRVNIETKNQPSYFRLLPKELSQEKYLHLKNLLESGRWNDANNLTRSLILEAGKSEEQGYLSDEQIGNFPCEVLKAIDRLWIDCSEGHFGFSVQKQIFNECQKSPQAFADRVGWRTQNKWISSSEVIYTLSNTPKGHLPWAILQVLTLDNAALEAFVYGLWRVMKTTIQQPWQKQLIADVMDFADSLLLLGEKGDKEQFKINLDRALSQNEPWWQGERLEELKLLRLFSLLNACSDL